MRCAYWTRARLEQIRQWAEETVMDFEAWQATAPFGAYRGVTFNLVRKLKSLPEWEGLSPEDAARSLDVAFQLLGDDWDTMIPVCGVNEIESRDDFIATWKGVRLALDPQGRDPVTAAYDHARAHTIVANADLAQRLGTCSPKLLVFLSLACYLQERMGPSGYILLPQERIAELMGVSQQQVSAWCARLRQAGVIEEINRFVPAKKATRWRCNYTVKFCGATL